MTALQCLRRRLQRAWLAFLADPLDQEAVLVKVTDRTRRMGLKEVPVASTQEGPQAPATGFQVSQLPPELVKALGGALELPATEVRAATKAAKEGARLQKEAVDAWVRSALYEVCAPIVVDAYAAMQQPLPGARLVIEDSVEGMNAATKRVQLFYEGVLRADRSFRVRFSGGVPILSERDNLEDRKGPGEPEPVAS